MFGISKGKMLSKKDVIIRVKGLKFIGETMLKVQGMQSLDDENSLLVEFMTEHSAMDSQQRFIHSFASEKYFENTAVRECRKSHLITVQYIKQFRKTRKTAGIQRSTSHET